MIALTDPVMTIHALVPRDAALQSYPFDQATISSRVAKALQAAWQVISVGKMRQGKWIGWNGSMSMSVCQTKKWLKNPDAFLLL